MRTEGSAITKPKSFEQGEQQSGLQLCSGEHADRDAGTIMVSC